MVNRQIQGESILENMFKYEDLHPPPKPKISRLILPQKPREPIKTPPPRKKKKAVTLSKQYIYARIRQFLYGIVFTAWLWINSEKTQARNQKIEQRHIS